MIKSACLAFGLGFVLMLVVLVFLAWPVRAGEQHGVASSYGYNTGRGDASDQRVACGGRLNVRALTGAHRSLPCGTRVTVRHRRNGRHVVVNINDRGPFVRGRVIDLSPAAARVIGMGRSIAPVVITW